MTVLRWTYSAGLNVGEPVVWSEVIAKLRGGGEDDGLRWCPDGDEHEMRLSPAGHAVCVLCGTGVLRATTRPAAVLSPILYARAWGARPCRECGEMFEPRKIGHHTCSRCYRFEPPATGRQQGYLLVLAGLLGVDVPVCRTPREAARAIDELLLLIDADPDIVPCAAVGCDRFVNRMPQAHVHCRKHR